MEESFSFEILINFDFRLPILAIYESFEIVSLENTYNDQIRNHFVSLHDEDNAIRYRTADSLYSNIRV